MTEEHIDNQDEPVGDGRGQDQGPDQGPDQGQGQGQEGQDNASQSGEDKKSSELEGTLTPLDRLVARGGNAFSLLYLLGGAIIGFEVVSRYVFNAPTVWAHETTTFICALCFAYGGAHCLARDKHIRITIFYQQADRPARRSLDILLSLLNVILGAMLTYAAWTMVERSFWAPDGKVRLETSGSAWDPTFPAWTKLALFIALLVITIQSIWHVVHHVRRNPDD